VSIDPELLSLMPHTITVAAELSRDVSGNKTYDTAESYTARVVNKLKRVINAEGHEAVSHTTCYVDTVDSIKLSSQITLPSGFSPQQPPIIRVDRLSDESGLHHTVIYC